MGVLQDGAAMDQVDPRLAQIGGIDAGQAGDLDVLGLHEGRPVERRLDGPAIALGGLELRGRSRDAMTMNFLGTQPRITQVPPTRCSSAMATRLPPRAVSRAARTPPEPAPMTKRS